MKSYVLLLRGINVGGKNILPMKELKTLLESLLLVDVRTYIQSGNVVFQAEDVRGLAEKIAKAIDESYGFKPKIMLISESEFMQAVVANPYPEAADEPKTLHLYFLKASPENADFDLMKNLAKETERFKLIDKVFYLYAPEGIGRSKLAEKVEKALGVAVTARNWRTVSKIKAMLE